MRCSITAANKLAFCYKYALKNLLAWQVLKIQSSKIPSEHFLFIRKFCSNQPAFSFHHFKTVHNTEVLNIFIKSKSLLFFKRR